MNVDQNVRGWALWCTATADDTCCETIMKGRANNAVTVTIAKNMVDVFVVLSFFISFLEPES